jgi:hypothetical protein
MRIDWRASLVPAAAVIPAPIAYIKVVAVKKLVVGFLVERLRPHASARRLSTILLLTLVVLYWMLGSPDILP